MKRFRFALRPVAVLRAHRELRAREAFAVAVQALGETEQRLAACRARVSQFEAALFAGRAETFSAAAEAQALAGYRRECAAATEAERAMLAARATVQQRRSEYVEAHRNVEVVQRLEDKAKLTHRAECAREEQASFDEFAGRRALLNRRRQGRHLPSAGT